MPHRISSLAAQVVSAEQLLAQPHADRLFIDVRLGDPEAELQGFREAHIHGAVHAQIREVFADPPRPGSGNLPLPDVRRLERQLRAWGVDAHTDIVVYGPSPALAARGWWTLTWAGAPHVRLLDGGLRAWVNAGGAVAQGDARPRPAHAGPALALRAGQLPDIDVRAVEALGPQTLLLDARDEASYQLGHIPRAVSLPAADLWTPGGALRTVEEIRERLAKAGAIAGRDVVVYCGGGVLSALAVLALQATGLPSRLYVGSWSEWSKSAERMARSVLAQEAA